MTKKKRQSDEVCMDGLSLHRMILELISRHKGSSEAENSGEKIRLVRSVVKVLNNAGI